LLLQHRTAFVLTLDRGTETSSPQRRLSAMTVCIAMRSYRFLKSRVRPRNTIRLSCRLQFECLEDRLVPSIADGTLLVATSPSSFVSQNASSFPTGIIGVNPNTGAQSVVSTGGLFTLPTYFTEAPDQQLYVSDLAVFGSGAIIRVDPTTGQQSVVA